MALRDTVNALDQRAKAEADFEAKKPGLIKEWQEAVQALATQVSDWLEEFVANGSMTVTPSWADLSEDALGTYSVRRLTIAAGAKRVEFNPAGRMMIGGLGMVKLHTSPTARDDNTYTFRREQRGEATAWIIVGPPDARKRRSANPLTQAAFEEVLDALLKMR